MDPGWWRMGKTWWKSETRRGPQASTTRFSRGFRETGIFLLAAGRLHRIEFAHEHDYANASDRITLPVLLRPGKDRVRVVAGIDTGASF